MDDFETFEARDKMLATGAAGRLSCVGLGVNRFFFFPDNVVLFGGNKGDSDDEKGIFFGRVSFEIFLLRLLVLLGGTTSGLFLGRD